MAKKNKTVDPPEKKNKKAVIIANSRSPEFREEYERTKEQYSKFYPGGVEFVPAFGYKELKNTFSSIDPNQDIIMMAHHNADAMYGVPVSDPNFRSIASPEGKTLASLFKNLQNRGYQGNCYLGICHGEGVAADIQSTGVNIPMFATPVQNKWVGSNPGNTQSFEDFFFGVEGNPQSSNFGQGTDPEMYDDFVKIDLRQQELMNRRQSGEPVKNITPLEFKNGGGLSRKKDYGSKNKPYPKVKAGDFAGKNRSYPIPTKADAIDALRLAGLHGRSDIKSKVYKKYPELKKAEFGEILENLGGVEGAANSIGNLLGGFQMLKQDINSSKQADKLLALSDIVSQATSLKPEQQRRRYIRPENNTVNPNELYPSYGTGTNFLAKNGASMNNGGNIGQMLGSFIGGGKGQGSGAGQVGATAGSIIGSVIPGIGTLAGGLAGGLIGGLIGGNQKKQEERKRNEAYNRLSGAALEQGIGGLQGQYSAFMNNGGNVAMGGDLQVHRGNMDVVSQNPYLPDTGETIMFNGPSHENGGIPISFGRKSIEVEGGEPAVKLNDGGNLVVFGDMKIPLYGVSELGDSKAKGKKFKTYVKELSKEEIKASKDLNKGLELLNEPIKDAYDKLTFASGKALLEGSNMKLKEIAQKKQTAASIQDAILKTAEEMNLDSGELSKGNIKKAKKGKTIKAQDGTTWPPRASINNPEFHQFRDRGVSGLPTSIPVSSPFGTLGINAPSPLGPFAYNNISDIREDGFAGSVPPDREKTNWMNVLNSALPFIRPSNRQALDPAQLSGEMFALATNRLEPVQAQTFQPLLESQTNISLQDQINANQADFNALLKQTRNNPAAQSALAAQKYRANSSVLGEQFRLNQSQQLNTVNRNRAALNDATLKNLAILDQQYERQAKAKSATKATAQAALNSIADKISRNKFENRTLGIQENLYNYRFLPGGQAFNMNPLAQFSIPQVAGTDLTPIDNSGNPTTTTTQEVQSAYDNLGRFLGLKKKEKTTTKESRNGSIVRDLKTLI